MQDHLGKSVYSAPKQSLTDSALSWYSRDSVADLCLHFQDHHGGNVNLLLWSYWLDVNQFELDLGFWQRTTRALNVASAFWVSPLRRLRRAIPKKRDYSSPMLRRQIQRMELFVEFQLLKALEYRTLSKLEMNTVPVNEDYFRYCLAQRKLSDIEAFVDQWHQAVEGS